MYQSGARGRWVEIGHRMEAGGGGGGVSGDNGHPKCNKAGQGRGSKLENQLVAPGGGGGVWRVDSHLAGPGERWWWWWWGGGLCTLRASLFGTFLQTLPDLVTPLKGHSLSPRSCPSTRSVSSERFG